MVGGWELAAPLQRLLLLVTTGGRMGGRRQGLQDLQQQQRQGDTGLAMLATQLRSQLLQQQPTATIPRVRLVLPLLLWAREAGRSRSSPAHGQHSSGRDPTILQVAHWTPQLLLLCTCLSPTLGSFWIKPPQQQQQG